MRSLTALVHLILVLSLSGCSDAVRSDPVPTSLPGSTLQEISRAEATWAQAAQFSYDMTVRRECFCIIEPFSDARVSVVDGEVESALGTEEDQRHAVELTTEQYMPWFTVAGQFQMMRDALADGFLVTASFEPSTGRPLSFNFRPESDTPLVDADIAFSVTDFFHR